MFKAIQSILPGNLKRTGMTDKIDEARILDLCRLELDRLIRNELKSRVRPLCFENGTVIVASLSDEATAVLLSHENEIVKNINKAARQTVAMKLKLLT